ncbi:hypothetical protein pb186bvf_005953 [Paramecium bursaria]
MISSLPILKKPSKRTIGIGAMITEIREMSTTKKPPKPKAPTIPFSEYITLKRDQMNRLPRSNTSHAGQTLTLPQVVDRFESPNIVSQIERNKYPTENKEKDYLKTILSKQRNFEKQAQEYAAGLELSPGPRKPLQQIDLAKFCKQEKIILRFKKQK